MSIETVNELSMCNPSTALEFGRIPITSLDEVESAVSKARKAQKVWGNLPWASRRAILRRWWKALSNEADAWADAITEEIGKPRAEAMAGDVVPTLDALRWTVRHGGSALKPERMWPGHQRMLMMPSGQMTYRPYGVVGIIGTWNYPLFLNAGPIAHALAAGNAVVWKPSELASGVGLKLQESLESAGLPEGLVAAVFGSSEVGKCLIESGIDKGVFTGGVENGRRVMTGLAARGVSTLTELSGFDAAIVLPTADIEKTLAPLVWGAYVGAGQTCVSIKRVYVVGDVQPWAKGLAEHADRLRVGDPRQAGVDLGPLISEQARERFHSRIQAAIEAGAILVTGGRFAEGPGWFYRPTVLQVETEEAENLLAGVFGPVIAVRQFGRVDDAIDATNASDYGLAASVWSSDLGEARRVASQLDVGSVNINDAVTTTMHATAPFGGFRASGVGRTHGPIGLREFAQPSVTFERRAGGFRPQLFPYGVQPVDAAMKFYRRLFH